MRRTRRRGVGHEAEGGQAVVLILLVVLVMGVGGWVAAYAGANGKVPRGTTVAGIEIGGRDRTAAAAALARGRPHPGPGPDHGRGRHGHDPGRTRGRRPLDRLRRHGGQGARPAQLGPPSSSGATTAAATSIAPVVHVDYRKLDALLDALDERAGQPARDAGISLSGGQIALTKPQNGVQIDQDHARVALVDAYARGPDRRSGCRCCSPSPTSTRPTSTTPSPRSPTRPCPARSR